MYNCLNCKIDVYKSDGCYMLNDSIWNQIHNSKSGFLCISCVEIKLNRQLTKDDFNNSYVNKRNWGTRSIKLASRLGYV